MVDDSMRLTLKSSTDYSIQTDEEDGSYIMARKKWLALEPWRPFYWQTHLCWQTHLVAGIYLEPKLSPSLLGLGRETSHEVYLACRLRAEVEKGVLCFHQYAFPVDPGRHKKRPGGRKGYWHLGVGGEASSRLGSINVLKELMQLSEELAFGREIITKPPDILLDRLIAWDERMGTLEPSFCGSSRGLNR